MSCPPRPAAKRRVHLTAPTALLLLAPLCLASAAGAQPNPRGPATPSSAEPAPVTVRVAAFDLGDVHADDFTARAGRAAPLVEVIHRLRANILLVSGISAPPPPEATANAPNTPGPSAPDLLLAALSANPPPDGLAPLQYTAFYQPGNSGAPSGRDLNRDGTIALTFPLPTPSPSADQRARAAAYSADCWGPGDFPGQRAMILLVDNRLRFDPATVRSFRLLPWDYMPAHVIPDRADGSEWFTIEEKDIFRLSTGSLWDVPVTAPNGGVIHILCSNPAPPVPAGTRDFNTRRTHDEIRFWADYVQGQGWIVDDNNVPGGLDKRQAFVILGNLNADPESPPFFENPINNCYVGNPRINTAHPPEADIDLAGFKRHDTSVRPSPGVNDAARLIYALPSRNIELLRSGVYRHAPADKAGASPRFPSPHFPVWIDINIPHWAQ